MVSVPGSDLTRVSTAFVNPLQSRSLSTVNYLTIETWQLMSFSEDVKMRGVTRVKLELHSFGVEFLEKLGKVNFTRFGCSFYLHSF